jgi:hypothetical protein
MLHISKTCFQESSYILDTYKRTYLKDVGAKYILKSWFILAKKYQPFAPVVRLAIFKDYAKEKMLIIFLLIILMTSWPNFLSNSSHCKM